MILKPFFSFLELPTAPSDRTLAGYFLGSCLNVFLLVVMERCSSSAPDSSPSMSEYPLSLCTILTHLRSHAKASSLLPILPPSYCTYYPYLAFEFKFLFFEMFD